MHRDETSYSFSRRIVVFLEPACCYDLAWDQRTSHVISISLPESRGVGYGLDTLLVDQKRGQNPYNVIRQSGRGQKAALTCLQGAKEEEVAHAISRQSGRTEQVALTFLQGADRKGGYCGTGAWCRF